MGCCGGPRSSGGRKESGNVPQLQFFISGRGWLGGTTGMYGIGFRPLSLGIPRVTAPFRFDIGAGLRATYEY